MSNQHLRSFLVLSLLAGLVCPVLGHGRLVDPPGRSSMWRFGFATPANYNDNQLYCGGRGHKCSVCGDPVNSTRENEAGGKYAQGIITRHYRKGQVITVDVELTANHYGYMTFKLCPNNNIHKAITEECLNRYTLQMADGSGPKYTLRTLRKGHYKIDLKLPEGLSCSQCVLQWVYHSGNNWNDGCLGCGVREKFYACSDIAISDGSAPSARSTQRPGQGVHCHAVGRFAGNFRKDVWCRTNCFKGYCPPETCQCT